MSTISILSIGNELLKGNTVNTNLAFIAKEATSRGHKVVLAMEIQDVSGEICKALKYALSEAECVITTGGLGPTFDDMTLESISHCLGLESRVDERALDLVSSRLPHGAEMTEARKKMAYMPQGAEPIPNPAGTAPGMLLKHGTKIIMSFPGVPREMAAMIPGSLENLPKSNLSYYQESVFVLGLYESLFSPVVDRLMKYYSGKIYIKSHPRSSGGKSVLELEVSSYAKSEDEGRRLVADSLRSIREVAEQMGGRILSGQEIPRNWE
ncbi:MAG: molybdopterin-binding protein [Candidatus Thermoplasmatota archaeon]|nr:molybdopterin-binding protein [Candidatus Thermoplasmatota archaeon]